MVSKCAFHIQPVPLRRGPPEHGFAKARHHPLPGGRRRETLRAEPQAAAGAADGHAGAGGERGGLAAGDLRDEQLRGGAIRELNP
jgi:hypothetical protein